MCPPAHSPPATEIDEYWTDEGVFASLVKFKSGCALPLNVTSDVNPYQFKPSDLPADIWYFCSAVKKDAESGFWMATGETTEILSNSSIVGLRTTLQFYEGQTPHAQKTNWMMQEYTTTEKGNNNLKDPRALCRVFLADESSLAQPKLLPGHCITGAAVKASAAWGPKPVSNAKSERISDSELVEKNLDSGTGPPVARSSPEPAPPVENFSEMDYILNGDYLELDDLIDPGSHSSSSANSSCLSMTSEEYFDSLALLRELGDESMNAEMRESNVKFNRSAPEVSKEVVVRPATSESLKSNEERKPSTDKEDHKNINPNTEASSSSSESEGTSKEEKKDPSDRTKRRKLMKFLCFLAF